MDFPGGSASSAEGLRFDTWSGKSNMSRGVVKKKKNSEQDRTTKAGKGTDQTGEEGKTGEISESKSSSFEYYIITATGAL